MSIALILIKPGVLAEFIRSGKYEGEITTAMGVQLALCRNGCVLLTGTDLTVEAIAARCGFGTVETLRQAFQSLYGVSPSHYRATQSTCAPTVVASAAAGPRR